MRGYYTTLMSISSDEEMIKFSKTCRDLYYEELMVEMLKRGNHAKYVQMLVKFGIHSDKDIKTDVKTIIKCNSFTMATIERGDVETFQKIIKNINYIISFINDLDDIVYFALEHEKFYFFNEFIKIGYRFDNEKIYNLALKINNKEIIEKIIDNFMDSEYLVYLTAKQGRIDKLEYLKELGYSFNFKRYYNIATDAPEHLLPILLSYGMVISADLLLYAIRTKNVERLQLLIKHGGDVNATYGPKKNTIILVALINRDFPIIDFLIESGANLSYRNINGDSMLELLFNQFTDYTDIIKHVLIKIKHNTWPKEDQINFQKYVVEHEIISQIENVLKLGGVDKLNNMGRTILIEAILLGKSEIVEILIRRFGANVNCPDENRKTPLQYATKNDIKNTLIARGAVYDLFEIERIKIVKVIVIKGAPASRGSAKIKDGFDINSNDDFPALS